MGLSKNDWSIRMSNDKLDALEKSLLPEPAEPNKVVDATPEEPSDVTEDIAKAINKQ